MKKIIFIVFIFVSLLTAQEGSNYFTKINFEHHTIKENKNKYICYISFSLPYNQLVFVKENENFLSGLSLSYEIFEDKNFVKREFFKLNVAANSFDETNSNLLKVTGYSVIELEEKDYLIKPYLSLLNTKSTYECLPIKLNLSSQKDSLLYSPIFVSVNSGKIVLQNEGNTNKFDDENAALLFLFPKSYETTKITFVQKSNIVFSNEIKYQLKGGIKYNNNDHHIQLLVDTSYIDYNLFLLTNVNKFLDEGDFKLIINYGDNKLDYNLKSNWVNKPLSLMYPDIILAAVSIVFPKDSIYVLERTREQDLYEKVKSMFNKLFLSQSKFNKKFAEFFSRVDYVEKHFRSLKGKLGVESDRGIIYLKYGKPDNIERLYKARDDISEIWKYNNFNKTFVFTDNSGTGDYILVK